MKPVQFCTLTETERNPQFGIYGYIAAIGIRTLDGVEAEAYGPFQTVAEANQCAEQREDTLVQDGGGEVSCATLVFDAQGVPMPNPKVHLWYGYDGDGSPYISRTAPWEDEDANEDAGYHEDSVVNVLIPGE